MERTRFKKYFEKYKIKTSSKCKDPNNIEFKNNLKSQIADLINRDGVDLLTLNSLQLADKLFFKIKELS